MQWASSPFPDFDTPTRTWRFLTLRQTQITLVKKKKAMPIRADGIISNYREARKKTKLKKGK